MQLRDKKSDTRVMVDTARAVKAALAPFGVPLLINDRVDVALASGADGVHVGQTDMAADDARRLLGRNAIIGLSINTEALAEAAPIETLDYVGIGGVYATTSKDQKKPPIGVDGLAPHRRCVPQARSEIPVLRHRRHQCRQRRRDHCRRRRRRVGDLGAVARERSDRRRQDHAPGGRRRARGAEAATGREMTTPIAVTIAGSDSGGGAGIQADLKTFSALGVYGASVITALTAQNTKGVTGIHDVPPQFITAQIDAVFSDLDVRAVKIGMLSQPAVIEAVAAGLDRWKAKNVVLDPVMVATSGDRLLNPDAIDVLKRVLIPRALVITPNLPEAAALLDEPIARNEDEMLAQAGRLRDRGARTVLIKGGHGESAESVDMLVEAASFTRLATPRVDTKNTHGTGCTLSSAIAAGLAKGLDLVAAAREAKVYVSEAIAAGRRLDVGSGHGPVHHFHKWW